MVRASRLTPAAVVVGLLGSGALVWSSSYATFASTTSTGVNTFTSGRVTITDSSAGAALFTASGLVPGSSDTRCVDVTYSGDVASSVRFYAQHRAPSPLSPHLVLTVDQIAVGAPCDASAASLANLHGGTAGAPLDDLVSAHHDYATGLGAWTPGTTDTRRYRFTYELADVQAAQGLSAQVGLTWEARST